MSLADLRLTIRRGESRNLLDTRHYKYTLEQLEKSAATGSIFAKRSKIKIRSIPPTPAVQPGIYVAKDKHPVLLRNGVMLTNVKIEEQQFADIDFVHDDLESELKYAAEEADIAFEDHAPGTLAVDKKITGEK